MFNPTISASRVTSLFGQYACPFSYYYEKVRRYVRKPSPEFIIGDAIEAVVTKYHETGELDFTAYDTVVDQARQNLLAGRFAPPKMGYPELSPPEQAEFDAVVQELDHKALLTEYAAQVKPLGVIAAQLDLRPFIAENLQLLCFPDLITSVGIVELKTAGRSWSDSDLAKKIQHVVEVAALKMVIESGSTEPKITAIKELFGNSVPVQYHVLVKTKTPKIQILPVEVTSEQIDQVLNLLKFTAGFEDALKEMFTKGFVPSEHDATACPICGKDHTLDFFFT